ncbi:MAG: hypothetical protein HY661_06030 [Betaproteobacteria bacterium]|nr:hypothetical protein [Betaproteobacteria bacterium]
MKVYRFLLSPVVLSLALTGWTAWWASTPVRAADNWNTLSVPIDGTVAGSPESVRFFGQATVESKISPDPDFNRPTLVLTIDLSRVRGVGSFTRARYVITGPEQLNRSVSVSHFLEFSFPFTKSGGDLSTARAGTASFALTVDPTTGAVSSATASVR